MSRGDRRILAVLGTAQFLMVLDQAVMNVSISQLVSDFHTNVTTIQAVIALYSLVMAALMIAGGKMGDIWGRRRAFSIGLVVYGTGSALTAAAWSVGALLRRLVVAGGHRRGARAAGARGAHGALVRGPGARARLRRARRRLRRGDRGRADPRRLGDDEPHLADRVRGRGARRDRDPARGAPAAEGQGSAGRGARPRRRRALRARSRARRVRRARGEHLGLAPAPQLADRTVRVLADPVRDRRRAWR